MRSFLAPIMLAVLLATGNGCSSTVLVSVPPRVDLKGYGTLGVVDFTSNSGGAGGARATQQLQEQIQAAQPGTRVIELGSRGAARGGRAPRDAAAPGADPGGAAGNAVYRARQPRGGARRGGTQSAR